MGYPDTALRNDPPAQDADFGGQPSSDFGGLAYKWINSVLQFLEEAYLAITRQPFATLFVNVQQAVAAGDVVCQFPDLAITNTRYYAARYASSINAVATTNVRVLGIALEPASAGATPRIAPFGIIPASIAGIVGTGNSAEVGLNATTGRLRLAQIDDVVLGRADSNGNVLFTGYGSLVP